MESIYWSIIIIDVRNKQILLVVNLYALKLIASMNSFRDLQSMRIKYNRKAEIPLKW